MEKAGLQFISYQELQATVSEKSANDHSCELAAPDTASADEDVSYEGERTVEGEKSVQQEGPGGSEGQEEEDAIHLVENIKISDPRRGTEVKLLGLRLGENTATVVAPKITVCLQCNR